MMKFIHVFVSFLNFMYFYFTGFGGGGGGFDVSNAGGTPGGVEKKVC